MVGKISGIAVQNLSIGFQNHQGKYDQVVKDISFNVPENKTVALVGESGSGKTVTGLSIAKLLPSKKVKVTGKILLGSDDIIQMSEQELRHIRGKEVGIIFQEPMSALNPLHTIGDQIYEVVALHNRLLPKNSIIRRVKELLDEVEMSSFKERLNVFPHQLSGGERQRIMIAIAIANNPKLLIADEPTTAIDAIVAKQIMALLKRIQQEHELSILLITHDLSVVKDNADAVLVMKDGVIIESGATKSIFSKPKHPYTKLLIEADLHRKIKKLSNTAKTLLEVKNLKVNARSDIGIFGSRYRDKQIIKNIELSIKTGETLGIIGSSGSGKTTLAMSILRLVKSQGEIIFNGMDINTLRARALKRVRKDLQVVFQDPVDSLNPRMTVFDIIREGPKAQGYEVAKDQFNKVIEDVGLGQELLKRYPHELSGGQRQRVAIARALILDPKLVILDEPTSALDKAVQKSVIDLLVELQKKYNLSYILISHDLSVIKSMSHRIAIISEGTIKNQGNYIEIIKQFAQ
jgi:microcin C transport system ATP-binding protein